jgi:hypothetical protein
MIQDNPGAIKNLNLGGESYSGVSLGGVGVASGAHSHEDLGRANPPGTIKLN